MTTPNGKRPALDAPAAQGSENQVDGSMERVAADRKAAKKKSDFARALRRAVRYSLMAICVAPELKRQMQRVRRPLSEAEHRNLLERLFSRKQAKVANRRPMPMHRERARRRAGTRASARVQRRKARPPPTRDGDPDPEAVGDRGGAS